MESSPRRRSRSRSGDAAPQRKPNRRYQDSRGSPNASDMKLPPPPVTKRCASTGAELSRSNLDEMDLIPLEVTRAADPDDMEDESSFGNFNTDFDPNFPSTVGGFTNASGGFPTGGTISAEDVIRESMASSRAPSMWSDRGESFYTTRSDSFAFSFSSRSTLRRSTISEHMLTATERFEPERELSESELSQVLTVQDAEIQSIRVVSIKEEQEQDIKAKNAKSRWAQHVKLKAANLFFQNQQNQNQNSRASISAQGNLGSQNKRILLQSLADQSGAATLQKWNRWMQDRVINLPRTLREEFLGGGTHDPMALISIEEIISNSRMMRYYASWLRDHSDQSKLFFLCTISEYRQFWWTLRTADSTRVTSGIRFSKENAHLLKAYGIKIAQKYLTKSAQFHIGRKFVTQEILNDLKRDIQASGEDALRTFDQLANQAKRALMTKFPEFRKHELYSELRKSVERQVMCLEEILMNQRFANFFWIFLFPHHYHREIALWLDIEYEFKPAYRIYTGLLKNYRGKEKREGVATQCRQLLRYIAQKYYNGDDEMKDLSKSVTGAYAKLQKEQDAIVSKFESIHLELYHRFITSRAYAEFSLYAGNPNNDNSIDDPHRLSALLLSYGLRAHIWPEDASRELMKKRSLEFLKSKRGHDAVCALLTFEAILSNSAKNHDPSPSSSGSIPPPIEQEIELRVVQHPLPHDPNPPSLDKSVENFLIPWCTDPHHMYLSQSGCPSPIAFSFRMTDNNASSTSSADLYASCVIIYKAAPMLSIKSFEKGRLTTDNCCRWVPYGVCIVSKYPVINSLRERVAEAYQFIVEREVIAAKNGQMPNDRLEAFQIDKKLIAKISRPIPFDSPMYNPPVPPSGVQLPLIDHTIQLLFETLDLSTLLTVFTAALLESRILLISSYYSVLLNAAESLRALMYPLLWHHVYLPVLPNRMLQYLQCPTPYIFGVDKKAVDEELMKDLGDEVLCIDLDKGSVLQGTIPGSLPRIFMDELKEDLYKCLSANLNKADHVFAHQFPIKSSVFPEFGVRMAFHDMVWKLLGEFGYHRYVWFDEFSNKRMVFFDEASYLATSQPETRDMRTLLIATQAFSEFLVAHTGFDEKNPGKRVSEKNEKKI